MTFYITLLGSFGLLVDGRARGRASARLPELIAYLLLHSQQDHARRDLAFLLWSDTTETQAQANLRKLLHQMRVALPELAAYVQTGPRHLRWRGDAACTCDVHMFEAALARARQAATARDAAGQREALQQAVAVYGGDLLAGHDAEWLLAPRERLRREFFAALERLIQLLEAQREYRPAIAAARRLVAEDPLHEASYRYLMRLHAANGDRASALQVYHACSAVLQRELGVDPSPTTQAVYQKLLTNAAPDATALSSPAPSLVVGSSLVGRHQEWAQLQAAWSAARTGQPGLVLLVGEGGIGKTRLAEEFLDSVARQGIATATARCYAAEQGLAYAPATAWLRARRGPPLPALWQQELGRLLPELWEGPPPPAEPPGEGGQQRLFEALARAMLAVQPCVYFIDDVQWCDEATLTWLHFLLRFDREAHLLVIGTLRPEEAGANQALHLLRTSMQNAGRLREIPLGPLDENETAQLAAAVAGQELLPERTATLYRESEGSPLLVVELVRAELELSHPAVRSGWSQPRGTSPLPPQVQALLMARLAPLSPPARELASLAAVVGRQFGVAVLARASRLDEESLVGALEELRKRQIIREQGDEAYDFSHDKLREVAYGSLGTTRRRMLHRHVAEALLDAHGGATGTPHSEIAAHFEQAGVPVEAAYHYRQAAEAALRVSAPAVAVPALASAIRLLPLASARAPEQDWGTLRAELHAGLMSALKQTGQLQARRVHIVLSDLVDLDDPDAPRTYRLGPF